VSNTQSCKITSDVPPVVLNFQEANSVAWSHRITMATVPDLAAMDEDCCVGFKTFSRKGQERLLLYTSSACVTLTMAADLRVVI
jgi:hypothetical protein